MTFREFVGGAVLLLALIVLLLATYAAFSTL